VQQFKSAHTLNDRLVIALYCGFDAQQGAAKMSSTKTAFAHNDKFHLQARENTWIAR